MTLESLRNDIDRLDSRILALLGERMEKALLTKHFKKNLTDSERETKMLEAISHRARCLVRPEFSVELYKSIIAESKALQAGKLATIGFQGEHGAYSELAARAWLGNGVTLPCHDFADVFKGVENGVYDFGIVPVENSLGGNVGPVNTFLISTPLHVVASVRLTVEHCLLVPRGTDYRELKTVYSHQQALMQCRHFVERNNLEPVEYYDTAGAARMLSEVKTKNVSALASRLAAEIYDLEIIKENCQDLPNNVTHFFVLAKEASTAEDDNKCSAVFSTEDKAGGLFDVLAIFADAGINLTRIESIPSNPGDYALFIDFDGSLRDSKTAKAIAEAQKKVRNFRILGTYKEIKV